VDVVQFRKKSKEGQMSGENDIGIAELLAELRRELYAAETNPALKDLPAQLAVDKAEVEIQFVVERAKEGGGGIKFNVISLGGKASSSSSATQRLLLNLTPLRPGDTRPGVAGAGEDYESRPPGST
jgi:hypothetical protein